MRPHRGDAAPAAVRDFANSKPAQQVGDEIHFRRGQLERLNKQGPVRSGVGERAVTCRMTAGLCACGNSARCESGTATSVRSSFPDGRGKRSAPHDTGSPADPAALPINATRRAEWAVVAARRPSAPAVNPSLSPKSRSAPAFAWTTRPRRSRMKIGACAVSSAFSAGRARAAASPSRTCTVEACWRWGMTERANSSSWCVNGPEGQGRAKVMPRLRSLSHKTSSRTVSWIARGAKGTHSPWRSAPTRPWDHACPRTMSPARRAGQREP